MVASLLRVGSVGECAVVAIVVRCTLTLQDIQRPSYVAVRHQYIDLGSTLSAREILLQLTAVRFFYCTFVCCGHTCMHNLCFKAVSRLEITLIACTFEIIVLRPF